MDIIERISSYKIKYDMGQLRKRQAYGSFLRLTKQVLLQCAAWIDQSTLVDAIIVRRPRKS